jgi:asparagine synthase (glutamine-hydrolysing)
MCGIFGLLNYNDTKLTSNFISEQAQKGQYRGPDSYKIDINNDIFLAFYRLAINGLDKKSDQPIKFNNKVLICNGEIYNYKRLYEIMNIKPVTNSDCECIIYMYEKYGIDYTVNALDGVFAFILIDYDINKIYISRDQFGVRPLFYLSGNNPEENKMLGFSSEMKQLHIFTRDVDEFGYKGVDNYKINLFEPGSYMILEFDNNRWSISKTVKFANFHLSRINPPNEDMEESTILQNIHDIFCEAVYKRVTTTDRPIACLLSGGLDSSIVAAIVSKIYNKPLSTYSIGLEGSEDLKYARLVAKHIGSNHTEVVVSEEDFFAFIPSVIENIESYDTTTVRASVGNLLISQYISESSEAKVIFNGDGSDELMGGYLYMNYAPDALEFDCECKRLLKNIQYFDVLRSDRSISTQGLEPRTPFLDRDFVTFYLSIPVEYRFSLNKKQEKYLFRKAFDKDYLPKEVLWRKKEAFSDGVSSKERSWYQIIDELVSKQTKVKYDLDKVYTHNSPETMEQLYYRTIFEQVYPDQEHIIPYFWMPKYVDATDSSARSLDIYNSSLGTINEASSENSSDDSKLLDELESVYLED